MGAAGGMCYRLAREAEGAGLAIGARNACVVCSQFIDDNVT
jgi:hypothetical protein